MVGEIEMEAIQEGRNLSDFRYGCIGYSMYLDDKKSSEGKGDKHPQLPICVGIERNAGLVANGVARNLNKVGAYIKDTMDDIMYPYRKRPK
uniref:DUF8204 domain-containing protein n=1 Tax=Oryza glumipatula TaxID=40148 RepID=A0A0E0AEB2_9ORYZ